jgi:hypothetical protein
MIGQSGFGLASLLHREMKAQLGLAPIGCSCTMRVADEK